MEREFVKERGDCVTVNYWSVRIPAVMTIKLNLQSFYELMRGELEPRDDSGVAHIEPADRPSTYLCELSRSEAASSSRLKENDNHHYYLDIAFTLL